MYYEKEYLVDSRDIDPWYHCRPSGLLGALQEAAVEAAVDAGSAAAQAIGTVVSCHVIPRPHGAVGETMPDMKYGEGHV